MASPREPDVFYREEGRDGIGGIDYCLYGQEDCLTIGGRGLCCCGLPPLRGKDGNPLPITLIEAHDTPND